MLNNNPHCVVSIVCALQDFSADFSDLDGVVQQRRQEMMESSSSGSQTPDYDKITGVCSVLIALCSSRPLTQLLYTYCNPLHTLQLCFIVPNVLSVSGVTVAQTVFGLQIAGVKPTEIWPSEALLLWRQWRHENGQNPFDLWTTCWFYCLCLCDTLNITSERVACEDVCASINICWSGVTGSLCLCGADFGSLPGTFLSAVKSGEVSVHADIHLQTPGQNHGAALKNGSWTLIPFQWKEALLRPSRVAFSASQRDFVEILDLNQH